MAFCFEKIEIGDIEGNKNDWLCIRQNRSVFGLTLRYVNLAAS